MSDDDWYKPHRPPTPPRLPSPPDELKAAILLFYTSG